jgi:hypothetical protein
MKLLQNEEVLLSFSSDKILLTNQRIMMKGESWGKSTQIFIFLENISSIEKHYKSNIYFLIVGILIMILGFFINPFQSLLSTGAGLLIGGIFLALWWMSRKYLITVSSKGGSSINFIVDNIDDKVIDNFLWNIQEAELNSLNKQKII